MSDTMTNGQKEDLLEAAIEAMIVEASSGDYAWAYVNDWTDSWVVYGCSEGTFQVDYSMDDSGIVSFSGDPVPVYSVTTYEPLVTEGHGARMEHRDRRVARLLDARAPQVTNITNGGAVVKSEPLTYSLHAPVSFCRDLILTDRTPGATERLARHRQEMDVITKEREARALRNLREATVDGKRFVLEERVTPGTSSTFAPPLWMNEFFAPAKRASRVLANLIPMTFDLPTGVSSINLPIITTGTSTAPQASNTPVTDTDIVDAAGTSLVVPIVGNADVALQLLEQSPQGAHLDWALFQDMSNDYDAQLEGQLLYGAGSAFNQILGLWNIANIKSVTYTDGSPTSKALYPYLGQMAAQIGDGRSAPPEIWLMRTARWSWLVTSEDSSLRPLEFPTANGVKNPTHPGCIAGWPVWVDDQIPTTITAAGVLAGGTGDSILACRPSDMILLEGNMQTSVMRELLSGTLGVRLQLHNSVAFIGNRYPAGIARMIGTGCVIQSGY